MSDVRPSSVATRSTGHTRGF